MTFPISSVLLCMAFYVTVCQGESKKHTSTAPVPPFTKYTTYTWNSVLNTVKGFLSTMVHELSNQFTAQRISNSGW